MKTQPATVPPAPAKAPHQSRGKLVRWPGSNVAARDLGIDRTHLHRVLSGERRSHRLLARWKEWLKEHPEFAKLNRKARKG